MLADGRISRFSPWILTLGFVSLLVIILSQADIIDISNVLFTGSSMECSCASEKHETSSQNSPIACTNIEEGAQLVQSRSDEEIGVHLLDVANKSEAGKWISYCVLEESPRLSFFQGREDVYVSPAEAWGAMGPSLQYVKQHAKEIVNGTRSLSSVVGSLSVLNILGRLDGLRLDQIDWFDVNWYFVYIGAYWC
jgi:hypothetical protein